MDIDFRTPLGIASGFDSNAEYYNAVSAMGFSFEIIGPLFFGPEGGSVRAAINKLKNNPPRQIKLGINFTKQAESQSEDQIARDILDAYAYSYDFLDFAVLNYANNSFGAVNELAFIKAITDPILDTRLSYVENKPLVLRLSPSLSKEELFAILDYCLMNGIDGVMLENKQQIESCTQFSKGRLPIIAILGSTEQATEFYSAGASLLALDCSSRGISPNSANNILSTLKK